MERRSVNVACALLYVVKNSKKAGPLINFVVVFVYSSLRSTCRTMSEGNLCSCS